MPSGGGGSGASRDSAVEKRAQRRLIVKYTFDLACVCVCLGDPAGI